MLRRLSLPLSLAFSLLTLIPLRPAAAANVLLQGKVTSTFFFTLKYTTDGKVSSNQARDDEYTKAITNSILVVSDNNSAALGQQDAQNNVTLVAPSLIAVAADNENNSFILDGLHKDAQTLVSFHLFMAKNADDPKKATALGHVVELLEDGTVNSTDFTLNLQLQ